MTDTLPCTCAPDERPYPCQHQYALGLCRKAEIRSLRIELDRCIAQIVDLTKIRLEDELIHGNVMGRIAIALFGEQNNRTDEECVAEAEKLRSDLAAARALLAETRDNAYAYASIAEEGISQMRYEYRKELVARIDAVLKESE